jgi:acylphosphatase
LQRTFFCTGKYSLAGKHRRRYNKIKRKKETKTIMRYALRVTGLVQGVGFRYTVCQSAEKLRLTGWIKNEWDTSVSIEAQGSPRALKDFLQEVQSGNRWAEVEHIKCRKLPDCPGETTFRIKD